MTSADTLFGPRAIFFAQPAEQPAQGPVPAPEPSQPAPPKKPWGFAAAALFVVGLLAGAWVFRQAEAVDSAATVASGGGPVRTAAVAVGSLPRSLRLAGTIAVVRPVAYASLDQRAAEVGVRTNRGQNDACA